MGILFQNIFLSFSRLMRLLESYSRTDMIVTNYVITCIMRVQSVFVCMYPSCGQPLKKKKS